MGQILNKNGEWRQKDYGGEDSDEEYEDLENGSGFLCLSGVEECERGLVPPQNPSLDTLMPPQRKIAKFRVGSSSLLSFGVSSTCFPSHLGALSIYLAQSNFEQSSLYRSDSSLSANSTTDTSSLEDSDSDTEKEDRDTIGERQESEDAIQQISDWFSSKIGTGEEEEEEL